MAEKSKEIQKEDAVLIVPVQPGTGNSGAEKQLLNIKIKGVQQQQP